MSRKLQPSVLDILATHLTKTISNITYVVLLTLQEVAWDVEIISTYVRPFASYI